MIEDARLKIPGALTAGVTTVATWVPSTVDGAVEAFRRTYTDITVRVVGWLPTTIPVLTRLLGKLADKAIAAVKAA